MTSHLRKLDPKAQLKELTRNAVEVISEEEFLKQLEKSYATEVPLKIKLGADPSRPDLHLGHKVVLDKMRQFQELGHEVIFIIGDFTGMIGDPTGRTKHRPHLSREEIEQNAETYKTQVFKVLDPQHTKVVFNSRWLGKLDLVTTIGLMAKITLQQMQVRDDFATRLKNGTPVFLHELLYPMLQAYDSCEIKADVELGGTDQKFNILLGRDLQRVMGQPAQTAMLMPLLEGLDGVQKMSKSLDNYIGFNDEPNQIFGKVMSIPDQLVPRYFSLLTQGDEAEIKNLHPMEAKKKLGEILVAQLYTPQEGVQARERFESVFSRREVPEDIPEVKVAPGPCNLIELLVAQSIVKSKSEARRLLVQGAIRADGNPIKEENLNLIVGTPIILKIGKLKYLKLVSK